MIDRYDFWTRPWGLRRMMDQFFEDALVRPGEPSNGASTHTMNVYEEGENLVVEAHLPGIKPEDVDASVEQGILTIRGETKADEERQARNYFVREHRTGSFQRSLRLPDSVDVDAAQATFQQGVLRLTFPRAEAARPRRVPITASGQAAFGPAPSAEPVADGTAPSADREATQATNGKATTGKAASGKRVSGRAAGRKTGDTRVSVGA